VHERHIGAAVEQGLGLVVPVDAQKVDCDVGVLGAECSRAAVNESPTKKPTVRAASPEATSSIRRRVASAAASNDLASARTWSPAGVSVTFRLVLSSSSVPSSCSSLRIWRLSTGCAM
jgi:hypothetical protein